MSVLGTILAAIRPPRAPPLRGAWAIVRLDRVAAWELRPVAGHGWGMGATSGMACACRLSPPRRHAATPPRLTMQGLRIRPACNVYHRGRDTHARYPLATLFEILSQSGARRVWCDRFRDFVADIGCAVGDVDCRCWARSVSVVCWWWWLRLRMRVCSRVRARACVCARPRGGARAPVRVRDCRPR